MLLLIVRKNLNPFVIPVTNINATIRTESYSIRIIKLTTSRSIGAKTVNAIAILVKDGYTMIISISYYNEAIQVNSNTIWIIKFIPTKSICTKLSYIMLIHYKSAYISRIVHSNNQIFICADSYIPSS